MSGTSSCRLRRVWYFFLQFKKGVVLLPPGREGRGTSSCRLRTKKGVVLIPPGEDGSGTSSSRLRREWYFFLQVKKRVVLLPVGLEGSGSLPLKQVKKNVLLLFLYLSCSVSVCNAIQFFDAVLVLFVYGMK